MSDHDKEYEINAKGSGEPYLYLDDLKELKKKKCKNLLFIEIKTIKPKVNNILILIQKQYLKE